MVASVNNSIPQQIPTATAFKPGEQNEALKSNIGQKEDLISSKQVNNSPAENLKITEPTKTAKTNANAVLARDNNAPDPINLGSSSNRGSELDITV